MTTQLSVNQQGTIVELSTHATARIRQRGLNEHDVDLIRAVGETVEDGFLMTNRAIEQQIQALRREIVRIERLRGVAVIEGGTRIITVYRADKKRVRRLLAGDSIQR
jgi:hypothetical protein